MKKFDPAETIVELLALTEVKDVKAVRQSITLDYIAATEIKVRLHMLFAYISGIKEERK